MLRPKRRRLERRHVVFTVMLLALLASSLNNTMIVVALNTIRIDLDTTLPWVGWVLTGFMLMQSIGFPLAGSLNDLIGRKRAYVGALVVFTASCFLAGAAPNVYVLILARATQGLASGTLLPLGAGIASDEFPHQRAQAVGLFSSVFPIGGVIGPTVGGLVIESLGWRVPFLTLGFLAAVLVFAAAAIFEERPVTPGRRFDWVGLVLYAAAVTLVLYATTIVGNKEAAPTSPLVLGCLAISAVIVPFFIWHEARQATPLLDVALLKQRTFAAVNFFNVFFGLCIFAVYSFIPLYATLAYGFSPAESGVLMVPRGLIMAIASTLAALLLPRTGYRLPLIAGFLLSATSLFLMSHHYGDTALFVWTVGPFLLLSGIGFLGGLAGGLAGPAANNAAIELMPHRVAAITGMRGMFRSMGGSIGSALIVLVASEFTDEAEGLATVFLGVAVLTIALIPLVFMIPGRVGGPPAARPSQEAGAGERVGEIEALVPREARAPKR